MITHEECEGRDERDDLEHEVADIPVDGPVTVDEKRLLASFGEQARTVNLSRVARLVTLLDRADSGALDEAGWREAENLAHQVVGSAGTFGHPAASVDAVAVEEYFALGAAGRPGKPDTGVLRRTLDRIRAEFER